MNILRKISFALTEAIFTVIPSVYNIFERIGSHEFFSSEAIQNISNNIYILVSVCMLFAFGIKLLNTIVNPDIIDDKKKGTKKTFINGIIAVVLISVVPFLFDVLYKVQFQVLGTDETTGEHHNLIQKIVFGTDGEYDSGSLLAGYTFAAFCYPNETVSNANLTSAGGNFYNKVIQGDIQYIDKVGDAINDEVNGEYELNYHIILSPLSGGYVLYQVILMCIDVAFRSVKLGILQLMAPLVICAFIFAGTDMLTRWIKEVISTYIIVFVKVAAITFMVYALSLLPDLFERLGLVDSTRDSWAAKGFIRVAFLIGLLQLVKKLPEIINTIFGTKLNTNGDGGIRGRLGEMAGVGAAAQKAWDQLRTHPIQTAMKPVGAVAGVGANIANRGIEIGKRINEASWGAGITNRGLRYGAAILGGLAGGVAGGTATSIGAARRGWQNGLRAPGQEAQHYRDTHQPGSTFTGRTLAGAARTLGFRTPYERAGRNDNEVEWVDPLDAQRRTQRMTVEQLKAIQSQRKDVVDTRNAARDSAVHAIEDQYSELNLTGFNGGLTARKQELRAQLAAATDAQERARLQARINAYDRLQQFAQFGDFNHASLSKQISDYANINLQQRQATYDAAGHLITPGETDEDYAARVAEHGREAAELQQALNLAHDDMRDHVLDVGADTNTTRRNQRYAALRVSGRDQSIINTNMETMHHMHRDLNKGADFTDFNGFNTFYQDSQTRYNSASSTLTSHQQEVYQRQNSPERRQQQASQQSVDNGRNNGHGNGGGGNTGGGH